MNDRKIALSVVVLLIVAYAYPGFATDRDKTSVDIDAPGWQLVDRTGSDVYRFKKGECIVTIRSPSDTLPYIDTISTLPVDFRQASKQIEEVITDFVNSTQFDRWALSQITLANIHVRLANYVAMSEHVELPYRGRLEGLLRGINAIIRSADNKTLHTLKQAYYFYEYIAPHLQSMPFQALTRENERYMLTRHVAAQQGPGFRTSYSIFSRQEFTRLYMNISRLQQTDHDSQVRKKLRKLRTQYTQDYARSHALLSQPQTALQLFKKGQFTKAFEKYMGDIVFLKEFDDFSPRMNRVSATRRILPQDRYMLGYAKLRNNQNDVFALQHKSFRRLIREKSPVVMIINDAELIRTYTSLTSNVHVH